MPGLLWWAEMVIGLSLASPFLLFAAWTLSTGDVLFGLLLLGIGLLGLVGPHYLVRRLKARQRAAMRAWLAKVPGVADRAE